MGPDDVRPHSFALQGKLHGEGAAAPGFALQRDVAAVRLNDPAHDRQAQARAARRIAGLIHLVEALPYALLLLSGDARAVVAHEDERAIAAALQLHLDVAASGSDTESECTLWAGMEDVFDVIIYAASRTETVQTLPSMKLPAGAEVVGA